MASRTEYIRPIGGVGNYKVKVTIDIDPTEWVSIAFTSGLDVPENGGDPKYFGLFFSITTKPEPIPFLNNESLPNEYRCECIITEGFFLTFFERSKGGSTMKLHYAGAYSPQRLSHEAFLFLPRSSRVYSHLESKMPKGP